MNPNLNAAMLGVKLAEAVRDADELFDTMYDAIFTAYDRAREDEGAEYAKKVAKEVFEKECRRENVTAKEKPALVRRFNEYLSGY